MSEKPPEDVSKDEIWNRLRRLEKAVFPNRREMLKATAGLGALGAAGAAGRASAAPGDDGDTVWGSSSNRDDYYADEVDANLVSTDVLFTPPQRTVLSKDTNQTLSNGSLEEITWESVPVDRQGIADLSNNGVTVPSNPDFDELKLRCKLRLSGDTGGILIFNRVNGNNPNSTDDARLQGDYSTGAENELNLPIVESPWIDANGGDTWTFKCRQNSGGYIDISSSSTLLEVFVQ